jgi:hypothetical protein
MLGGLGLLVVSSAVVSLWLFKEIRSSSGGSLATLAMFFVAIVPAARNSLFRLGMRWIGSSSNVTGWVAAIIDWKVADYPVGSLVVAGSVIAFVCVVITGVNVSIKYFAPLPEPQGPIEFKIGSDGRRIDMLGPDTLQRRMLAWIFWVSGLIVLLFSTQSDAFSAVICLLALLETHFSHWLQLYLMSRQIVVAPGDLMPLISPAAFALQSKRNTYEALRELQDQVKADPTLYSRFDGVTELRLRRFADSGHCQNEPFAPDVDEIEGWSCKLM